MPESKTTRSSKLKPRRLWVAAGAVALIVVGCQAYVDVVVLHRTADDDSTAIINLIIGAVEGLNKPAVTEPRSGDQYFPEARLFLPADQSVGQPTYSYLPAGNGAKAELHISTSGITHRAEAKLWAARSNNRFFGRTNEDVFAQVPHLQACARGVSVFFEADAARGDGLIAQGSHQVADGRTLYFYTEPNCRADLAPLVADLRQLRSY